MCWCWSDRPNHRPSFNTILSILHQDTFFHLLASYPMLKEEEDVTSSCMRLFKSRRISSVGSLSHSMMVDQSLASLGVMNLVHGKSSLSSGEIATQIWYGTEFGKYGMIQFQNSGVTHEVC